MAPKTGYRLGLVELTDNRNSLGKSLLAEAIGVFFINYFGCLSCLKPAAQTISFTLKGGDEAAANNQTYASSPLELSSQTVVIALSFGLVIFVLVQVSGARGRQISLS